MRSYRGTSNLFSVIRAGFTSATVLAILVSCSDSISAPPSQSDIPGDPSSAGIVVVETQVPDSLKNPSSQMSGMMLAPGHGASASLLSSDAALSSSAAARAYSVSSVAFAPEAGPFANAGPFCDDCVMLNVPLGFSFSFYGTDYSKIHISSNGLVGFGPTLGHGCCKGGAIPSNDVTNNIIAFAWSDWSPNRVTGGIRYETRGAAPNRRFVLQFNSVPEFGAIGRLTTQLVLSEGSNEITVHTSSMTVSRSDHLVTQGIENATATEAAFVPGRVRNFFNLSNDAVRFAPPPPNRAPVVTPPANLLINTGAGSCIAAADPGAASFTDDAPGATLAVARSDALALDAAYPKGVTTIAWTATDVEGLTTTANQTVTVNDAENPGVTAPASISVNNDPGLGSAAVAVGAAIAADNCPDVSVAGERGDGAALGASYPVGITTITWTATDASGNTASAIQNITVSDVDAPSLNVPADVTVDATTRNGAAVSFATSASDNVGVAGIYCTRASGSIFPVGSTSVTCTAWDAAGNRTSRTFIVSVRGASAQIAALIEFVEGLGLHNGTANPMLAQLRHALRDADSANPDGACRKMNDFIRMAAGKKGAEISGPEVAQIEVAQMLADARRILNVLDCEVAERNPLPSFGVK